MQFEIILATIGLLYVYQRFMIEPNDLGINRLQLYKINEEPLNCIFCLSFWTSIILSIFTYEYGYLSIPLIYRVVQLKLIRS